jgi:hypothetical protein
MHGFKLAHCIAQTQRYMQEKHSWWEGKRVPLMYAVDKLQCVYVPSSWLELPKISKAERFWGHTKTHLRVCEFRGSQTRTIYSNTCAKITPVQTNFALNYQHETFAH